MQISSRFTMAIHIFACIEVFEGDYKITSDFIATSVNVNPVIIRKLLGQLKSAGLINVARGSGGASVTKPLDEITLFDVYKAVECVEYNSLFHIHENPNRNCPVGRNIHAALGSKLYRVQRAMEDELRKITVEDIVGDTEYLISKEIEKK